MHINEKYFTRTKCYSLAVMLMCIFHRVSSVVYSDQFVIQMDGGATLAKRFVEENGFNYLGQIFEDHYHIKHKKIAKRSAERSTDHHKQLSKDPRVKWISQQIVKKRVKRDINSLTKLNDPKWPEMWYLNRGQGLDMNVQAAWAAGATGKDIVVTILDDGLEKDHPDIVQNYDPNASYDVNNRDADPQPRYDFLDSNRHGTRCAGEVAASANNSLCSVGVAYEAHVGGVRMLDGDVTDAVEARSLSLNPQHIDIYSASWGPDDDGKTVDGPGDLATRAFKEGIEKGRKGLGSIFVWASGNGGRERDNCNCDGYTNAIWTLSISSATENGLVPWYSEACSSTLSTTYSSGSSGEKQIITTDLHHGCTTTHTGTSASAPLAAGICALALEVNKQLTWRDMQHIVVRTAKPANLFARDWKTNGVGRNVSHSFGYGMMDAAAMVSLARSWTTAPPQKMCEVRAQHMDKQIQQKSKVELSLEVHCENVHFLEHVQAKISLSATRRGDIQIYLTSPSGTKSTLLAQRHSDNSRSGFQAWPFMTVHNWGENPNGVWKLEVHSDGHYAGRASLKDWSLLLYGTTEDPDHANNEWNSALSNPTYPSTDIVSFLHDVPVSASKLPVTSVEDNSLPQKAFLPQGSMFRGLNENEYLFPLPVGPHKTRENPENSSSLNNGCALMDASGLCLDCQALLYLAQGRCFPVCPDGHYASPHPSVYECLHCHYSCRKCVGSNDYQCTACYGDAELQDSMYCRPLELLLELRGFTTWYAAMTTAFVLLCVVLLGLVAAVVAGRNHGLFTCCKKETTYSSLSAPSSKINYPGEGRFVPRHVYSDSDEEV